MNTTTQQPQTTPLALTDLSFYDNHVVNNKNHWYKQPVYHIERNSLTATWTWIEHAEPHNGYQMLFSAGEKKIQVRLYNDRNTFSNYDLDWTRYAGNAQIISWAVTHENFIHQLNTVFQLNWTLEAIQQTTTPISDPEMLTVGFQFNSLDNNSLAMHGEIIMSQEIAKLIDLETFKYQLTDHRYDSLPLSLNASMRTLSINQTELDAITIGAIICLPASYFSQDSLLLNLAIGRYRLAAQWSDFAIKVNTINRIKKITIHRDTAMKQNTKTDNHTESPPPDKKNSITTDELEITLRLEVAQLSISLAELKNLQPGFIFSLDKPLTETSITLFANEQKIGTGELVHVGDSMGVKVNQLKTT